MHEKVIDLRFLDGQGEELDLQGLDLHILDQAAQLRDRDPPLATLALTSTLDTVAESSKEAAVASHSRASGASRPSRSTCVISHLVLSLRNLSVYF